MYSYNLKHMYTWNIQMYMGLSIATLHEHWKRQTHRQLQCHQTVPFGPKKTYPKLTQKDLDFEPSYGPIMTYP